MLHVRKVIEHVYEKVIGRESSANNEQACQQQQQQCSTQDNEEDVAALAETHVELMCQDQVITSY